MMPSSSSGCARSSDVARVPRVGPRPHATPVTTRGDAGSRHRHATPSRLGWPPSASARGVRRAEGRRRRATSRRRPRAPGDPARASTSTAPKARRFVGRSRQRSIAAPARTPDPLVEPVADLGAGARSCFLEWRPRPNVCVSLEASSRQMPPGPGAAYDAATLGRCSHHRHDDVDASAPPLTLANDVATSRFGGRAQRRCRSMPHRSAVRVVRSTTVASTCARPFSTGWNVTRAAATAGTASTRRWARRRASGVSIWRGRMPIASATTR